uniref:Helicase C-terminal domain-containing protein n=1 Tax=Globodera rostochiensis TaxID=31243 RepID=A0A914I6W2_GLORO
MFVTFETGPQNFTIQFFGDNLTVNIRRMNTAIDFVTQEFRKVQKFKKFDTLVKLLLSDIGNGMERTPKGEYLIRKTLVFVERKRSSDMLAIGLKQNNIQAISINRDRTLEQCLKAAEDLASGKIAVLIVTDDATRGLKFTGVETVVNFDLPEQDASERYIHRIGCCTGRVGISFFDPCSSKDLENASDYVKIMKRLGHEVPDFLHEIVAVQM